MSYTKRKYGRKKKASFRKKIVIVGSVMVVFLGGVYAFSGSSEYQETATLEEAMGNLKDENLGDLENCDEKKRKAKLKAYGKVIVQNSFSTDKRKDDGTQKPRRPGPPKELREQMEKLSKEDRRAFHAGAREAFREHMKTKISNYFAASEAEREKLLEEEAQRIYEMHKSREERRKNRKEEGDGGPPDGKKRNRRRWQDIPREKREEHMRRRLNDETPEERAQKQEYFRLVREKVEQLRNKK